MLAAATASVVRQCAGNGLAQPNTLVGLAQQQDTGITADLTTAEIKLDATAGNGWKVEGILVAFCHGGIFWLFGLNTLIFQIIPPFFTIVIGLIVKIILMKSRITGAGAALPPGPSSPAASWRASLH
jgi:hypothetical protein